MLGALENIDEKGIAFTIRSVFIVDPSKKVRLTMMVSLLLSAMKSCLLSELSGARELADV